LNQGDATTITWSLAPDGTTIPNFIGETQGGANNFVAFIRGIYNDSSTDSDYTDEPWFDVIESVFDRWSELSGITYVYEPNDDGIAFSDFASQAPGVVGVRGDVRIGGHNIDGNSGILAYNFFPDVGDMIIDTADNFYSNTSNNSRALRNVLAHEAGHGFGVNHVESNNAQFLMEPFINNNFDGAQLDDILAIQRGYGDANEALSGVDNSTTAFDLGSIADGQTVSVGTDATDTVVAATDTSFVSIDDNSDVDFYSFTVVDDASVSVTLTPQGPTYNQGPQGGSQSSLNTSALSDLTVEIIGTNGTTVLASANATGAGSAESISDFDLSTAGTYFVRVSGADNSVQLYRLDTSVTVDAPASNLAISPANITLAEGDSGNTAFTYTITRTGDLSTAGSVAFAVTGSGGNAANAADFGGSLPSGTVTLPANTSTASITVNVAGDVVAEEDEGFTVTLSNASAGISITTSAASGTITNDDTSYAVSADAAATTEGDSGNTAATFTVTRTGDTSAASTVDYTVAGSGANAADAADFENGTLPSGQVSFGAGDTTATITVNINGDLDVENDNGFDVTISSASDGSITNSTASSTITNDDSDISIAADSASKNEGDSGTTDFTFTVSRTGSTASASTVSYAVSGAGVDAADFAGNALPAGTATIATGQTSVTLTIDVNGDNDIELDEGFTVTISNPSGNAEIVSDTANGTIINDDVQIDLTLVAVDSTKAEGDSGTTAFTFEVTRTGLTTGASSVDFAAAGSGANSANAADFSGPTSGTVSFAANDTVETITILVAGDTAVENDETFTVTLSDAVNAEIVTGSATGTIINDDTAVSISADSADKVEGDAGTTPFTFTVTRSGVTTGTSSVDYTVAGDVDASDFASALSGNVSFAANETTKTITLDVVGDTDVEGNEDFTVTLSNPTGTNIATAAASGTIQNDDGNDSGVTLVGGTLTIVGTSGNDDVVVRGYRRWIRVFFRTPDETTVTYFKQSDVSNISVDVGDGHDRVYLNGRIYQASTIDLGAGNDRAYGGRGSDTILGGDGHDRIYGRNGADYIDAGEGNDYVRGGNHNDIIHAGNGANRIFGGNGHDILVGGDNDDYLNGGRGKDILIGGAGSDVLRGRGGEDIVIAGSTIYDNDDSALNALLSVWRGGGSYASRINTLRTGGGSLNGIKLEAGTTVLNDNVRDYVYGGRSKDWFFADTTGSDADRVFRRFNEVLDEL
jgi:Ca2+-binding RTX toxin-like protein